MTNSKASPNWATSPDLAAGAPNLWGQVYVVARQRGWEHSPAEAAADDASSEWGDAPVVESDLAEICAEVLRTH